VGQIVQFERQDGSRSEGYLAEPSTSASNAGVVVVQEWWGLNEQIRAVADRIAAEGYRALVPDLYGGELAPSSVEAQQLMSSLNWSEAVKQDIAGAARYLKATDSSVAVLGFCMGGALTLMAASSLGDIDAAVCFYGIPPEGAADFSQIRIPLQAHFANSDDWCTPVLVDELEGTLQEHAVPYELYRYDAQHAFFNEQRPEVYSPEAAETAWQRTTTFLERILKA
jgi:carboxymethylenebutenolidase